MRLVIGLLLLVSSFADIYLHNMRGSNNRLDDENRDRNNANRCFDSQNNNRGGYNRGNVYYYTGSRLTIDWTSQHSCGAGTNNCELILQYACDPLMRDGTDDRTIPINPKECYNLNCDTDVRFGRHESVASYMTCKYTSRNKGLFTANQNLKGNSAQYTRQNPEGNRRGVECPEERDYYPYWRPSIWRDLAVLTNDAQRCADYKAQSENVKARWVCSPPDGWVSNTLKTKDNGFIPITKDECEALTYRDMATNTTTTGVWRQDPNWKALSFTPECRENQWSRDNHLGNVEDGYPASYNLTLPDDWVAENCVLRLRYNISTGDYPGWFAVNSTQSHSSVNSSLNNPTTKTDVDPSYLDIWSRYRLTYADVEPCFNKTKNTDTTKRRPCREYVFQTDPEVDIFGSLVQKNSKNGYVKLELAINTDQYGRTFQDRSHVFAIRARPSDINKGDIINIGVQGKRGNIVQTYPGTEYDFHPYIAHVKTGQYVHFQWTGSNANPQNNAGQGRAGTDRHNVIAMKRPNYYEQGLPYAIGANEYDVTSPPTYGHWGNNYPAPLPSSTAAAGATPMNANSWAFLGLDYTSLWRLATLQSAGGGGQHGGNLKELDDAGTYFDLGLRKVTTTGIFNYICTRNNNFSNRSHKGKIVVDSTAPQPFTVGWNGGTTSSGAATISVAQGSFMALNILSVSSSPSSGVKSSFRGEVRSEYVTIGPLTFSGASSGAGGGEVSVDIEYRAQVLGGPKVWRSDSLNGTWSKVGGVRFHSGVASFKTSQGGVFVVEDKLNKGALAGIIIAAIIFLFIVAFIVYMIYKKRRSESGAATKQAVQAPAQVKSSRAPPAAPAAPAASSSSSASRGAGAAEGDLPAGWQAVTDPNDGATYYVNATKGLSQWELPTE